MKDYQGEQILVVTRQLFDNLSDFQGINTDVARYLPSLLNPENNFFMDRGAAEDDPPINSSSLIVFLESRMSKAIDTFITPVVNQVASPAFTHRYLLALVAISTPWINAKTI